MVSVCKGFLDAWRCWVLPLFRSPGVQESSREETAGRLCSVVPRAMGKVSPAAMAVLDIGVSEHRREVFWAVCVGRPGCIFKDSAGGMVLRNSD